MTVNTWWCWRNGRTCSYGSNAWCNFAQVVVRGCNSRRGVRQSAGGTRRKEKRKKDGTKTTATDKSSLLLACRVKILSPKFPWLYSTNCWMQSRDNTWPHQRYWWAYKGPRVCRSAGTSACGLYTEWIFLEDLDIEGRRETIVALFPACKSSLASRLGRRSWITDPRC